MDCSPPGSCVYGISQKYWEYWSGLQFPSPEDFPDPGIEPRLLHWQVYGFFITPWFQTALKRNTTGLCWWSSGIGTHLPMEGKWVWSLVREDSTRHRATKPVHHNYTEPKCPRPVLGNKRSHCIEKPVRHNKQQPLLAATRESPCTATTT